MKAMIKGALILLLAGWGAHAPAAPEGGEGTVPGGDPPPPALAVTPSGGEPGEAAAASAGGGIGTVAVPQAGHEQEGEAERPQGPSTPAETAALAAASPAGDAAPVPTAAPEVGLPVAAEAPAPRIEKVVRFKNGSVMTCRILGEESDKIVVEMFGGQMDIPRDEIDYYGDTAELPSVKREEIVITGEAAAPPAPPAAVQDAAAPAPSDLRQEPSGQVGAPASAPALRPSVTAPLPPPAAAATRAPATLDDLNASPEKYLGERIVFPEMVMGVLQKIDGIYGLELLPPHAKKGQRRHGGTSPELTTRGVTFVLSEAQAADLKEHSKPYDRARIECTVERRTIGNVAYWVAPVSRIDVYQREGGGFAWTIW